MTRKASDVTDNYHLEILKLIQSNERMTRTHLSHQLGWNSTRAWKYLGRLEDAGFIKVETRYGNAFAYGVTTTGMELLRSKGDETI